MKKKNKIELLQSYLKEIERIDGPISQSLYSSVGIAESILLDYKLKRILLSEKQGKFLENICDKIDSYINVGAKFYGLNGKKTEDMCLKVYDLIKTYPQRDREIGTKQAFLTKMLKSFKRGKRSKLRYISYPTIINKLIDCSEYLEKKGMNISEFKKDAMKLKEDYWNIYLNSKKN